MEYYKNLSLEDIDGEIWSSIVGYSRYMVSNYARVKKLKNIKVNLTRGRVSVDKDRILKQYKSKAGRLTVKLCNEDGAISKYVHRLVGMAFLENPENLPMINHLDFDPTNNLPQNLEWCTAKRNSVYSYLAGRLYIKSGEENASHKLTDKEVRQIKLLKGKVSQRGLARMYKVSKTHIKRIFFGVSRKTA